MTHAQVFDYNRWFPDDGNHEEAEWFTYQCRVERVVDGDTLDIVVDLGFHARRTIRVRLAGIDTSEVYGVTKDSEEHAEGETQAEYVRDWISDADRPLWPMVATTAPETGKYGRYIAVLRRKTDDAILNAAIAEEFPGVDESMED